MLATLSTLSIPSHAYKNWYYQLAKNFDVYLNKKLKFIFNFFLEILQRFCKVVILSTLGMPIQTHQNW